MSKQVDERIVSMQFDNKHFESNVNNTMSTLDKLKAKLHLPGASKGLDEVSSKFSALEVIGVTALANITNSAVNAGKRIVESLTIAPVRDGFNEYEMTLNAVQTTMAATGKTAKEVEDELKKLDEYADKTVYSTADMLNNLPKFTNAGVELGTATKAMIGIANATALAGGDAGKASIAFYNLGQAIGTGYLTRMDYNSINNAGIATMEWKNQMVEAAIAHGTLTKVGEDAYKAGNKTLSLQQLFIDGLQEQWATTDVMIDVFGDYGDETTEIGKKAYSSAQDIKSFSQMMESLKATAGTGWKDTWQIIFGGLDEAKELWTGLSNFIGNLLTKFSDARNAFLEGALGKSFSGLAKKLKTIMDPIKGTIETVKSTTTAFKDLGDVVNKVIRGDFGNGVPRYEKLTEAGYNYYAVQNKVNETLGCSFRYSEELAGAQTTLTKTQEKTTSAQKDAVKVQGALTDADIDRIASLVKLSDAELKALGYTNEQIAAFRELERTADKLGLSIKDFLKNIDDIDGRWLLLNSFKNIGQGLVSVFKAMRDAWVEIFPPMTSDGLFNIIAGFHKFTTHLKVSDETADKLKRTLKGVFAILKIMFTLIGGPIKVAFKVLVKILGALNIDILDLTAGIGDAIVAFSDWLDSVIDFNAVAEFLVPIIDACVKKVKSLINAVKESKVFKMFTKFLSDSASGIVKWFKGLKDADNIPKYIFEGLINGLKFGISGVLGIVGELGKSIISTIKNILGIHSPSREFFDIGTNIVEGLFNGISDTIQIVFKLITAIGEQLIGLFKNMNLDLGTVLAAFTAGGFTIGFVKIASAFKNFSEPFKNIGSILDNTADTVKIFNKNLKGLMKSISLNIKAEAIKTLAISIAILAGSIAILSLMDVGKMWSAVGAIIVLMGALVGLTVLIDKFGGKTAIPFAKVGLMMLGLSAALLIMAIALKKVASIDPEGLERGIMGLSGLIALIITVLIVIGNAGPIVDKSKKIFLNLAMGLLVMTLVVKILGSMDESTIKQGGLAMLAFGLVIAAIVGLSSLLAGSSKNVDKIGGALSKISMALLMMALTVKILGGMKPATLVRGTKAIILFGGMIVGLMAATKLVTGSRNVDKIGGAIFKIAGAMAIMALTTLIIGSMDLANLVKGTIAVAAFAGIIVGLIAATKLAGPKPDKLGKTILLISAGIAALALTAAILGFLSIESLAKGIIAVGLLSTMIGVLMYMTSKTKNCMKTVLSITAAIAVLAISLGVLSMIDPLRLATATLAMAAVMGMFALLLKTATSAKKAMSTIILLSAAIAVLAGALFLVGQLPAGNALAASGAMTLALAALTGAFVVLSKIKIKKQALSTMIMMTAALGVLSGALFLVGQLPVGSALPSAVGLSTLLLALTASLAVLSTIKKVPASGIAALALMGLIVAELAAILGIMALLNIEPSIVTSIALSTLLLAMSKALLVLGVVGLLGPAAFVGIGALATLIVALGGLFVAIGALQTYVCDIEGFIDTALPILEKIGIGIGKFLGGIVGGFIEGVAKTLPTLGLMLSEFAVNATPFIELMKTVDSAVLTGIGVLTAAILALTVAEFINGIMGFLSIGDGFGALGTKLSQFMTGASGFIEGAKGIDPSVAAGIESLTDAILKITAGNLLESITSWITGENSLAKFGEQLGGLGTNLATFVTNLGEFTPAQVATIQCASDAIKALAEAADATPNTGGLWQGIVGESGLSKFSAELPTLGTNLASFITNLGTFDSAQLETVKIAGEAITALADADNNIQKTGGLWQAIAGESGLSKFSAELPTLGGNLSKFIKNLGKFEPEQLETVKIAGDAIKALADADSKVQNTGGLWQAIVGESGLAKFSSELPTLGGNLSKFIKNLGTFKKDSLTTVSSVSTLVRALADMCSDDVDIDGVSDLGENLVDLGEGLAEFLSVMSSDDVDSKALSSAVSKIKTLVNGVKPATTLDNDKLETFSEVIEDLADGAETFVDDMEDIDTADVDTATSNFKDVVRSVKSAADVKTDKLSSLATALSNFGKKGITDFVNSLSGDTAVKKVSTATTLMIAAFIKVVTGKTNDSKKAFEKVANAGKGALTSDSIKKGFNTAGQDLVKGFVNGVNNKDVQKLVSDAGSSLGKKALAAAKAALDEHSPSKEMYKVGKFATIGFVNAFYDYEDKAARAGSGIAKASLGGLNDAIHKVSDIISDGIDAEPTIRPVLDLSNVRSGANAIGSMFSGRRTLAVDTRTAGTIAASMAGFQNGNNSDEIVSSIKALRKDMADMPRESITIGGITYDGDSAVADAVQTLVRAAKMERRT